MARLTIFIFVSLMLPSVAPQSCADETSTGSARDITRWIEEIGNSSFIQREFAVRKLIEAGEPAIPALLESAVDGTDIASVTAVDVLRRIITGDDPSAATAAHRGLAAIIARDNSLPAPLLEEAREAIRLGERQVAGIVRALGGLVARDDSLSIIGLQINDERFDDQHAAMLARLSHLTWLDVRGTGITDASIDAVIRLEHLENLNLSDTQVTSAGLLRLDPLQSLQKLSIYRIPIDQSDLENLQTALENCEIRQ